MLAGLVANREAVVVDVGPSRTYRRGHVPSASFAIRSRLAEALEGIERTGPLVFTSPDGLLAAYAAVDAQELTDREILVLEGGTEGWTGNGRPLSTDDPIYLSAPDDVVLTGWEIDGDRLQAFRDYLAWEVDLLETIEADDTVPFRRTSAAVPR